MSFGLTGTKRTREYVMSNGNEFPSVPPGFLSLTAFTLKKTMTDQGVEFNHGKIAAPLSEAEIEKIKSSLIHRPWICFDKSDRIPQTCDTEQTEVDMKSQVSASLPKGVSWGCSKCYDCMKVTARWRPEESHLSILDSDAPVFSPNEEEFSDTMKYIAKIRSRAERYGICRIVPPPSWRPPCLLNDKKTWETSILSTHVQRIDGLQNLYRKRKLSELSEKMATKMPIVETDGDPTFYNEPEVDLEEACVQKSEFVKGPVHTLKSFKKNADDFKRLYFSENGKVTNREMCGAAAEHMEPQVASIEGEYWRIIKSPTEEMDVLCAANLATQNLGSGFPTGTMAEHSEYAKSGWNLNNIGKLPGSLLRFGCYDNSAILSPQLFIGMCFSSQCWRTEKHHLYSLSYMHMGGPKVWYSIPGMYYLKFVEIIKKLFPQLSKHPKLIHECVAQLSPSVPRAEGIPVYRCEQKHGEFVLTFPGAYHSEFCCGFTCSETASFATFDWLPHGQDMVELYGGYCLKTSISHDKLLIGAALEAANAQWEVIVMKNKSPNNQLWRSGCGKDGILTKALKSLVRAEGVRREYICNLSLSTTFKESDVSGTKRECCICSYDIYLSGVVCSCSEDRFACMRHAKQLCPCPWVEKRFLLRYTIDDMNMLVEALVGNVEAIKTNRDRINSRVCNGDWVRRNKQQEERRRVEEVVIVVSDDEE